MITIQRDIFGRHTFVFSSHGRLPASRQARKLPIVVEAREMPSAFSVETIKGIMAGKAGDFLVTGVEGEMYPCDRAIFLASYEFVNAHEEEA